MTSIETLQLRLKELIARATDSTKKKTLLEWLQLCRDGEKEQEDKLVALRTALIDFGAHVRDCAAVRSEATRRWSVLDDDAKTCNCGLVKALGLQ